MRRLHYTENLIKSTKKKFLYFSIIGIGIVSFISFAALQYHQSIIKHQMVIQNLNEALNRQLILIHEIASLGERFDDVLTPQQEQRVKKEFDFLIKRLNKENKNFSITLKQAHISDLDELEKLVSSKDTTLKIVNYMKRAKQLSDKKPDTLEEIRADIRFLSVNSRTGLSNVFSIINKKIKDQNRKALDRLDQIGLLLVAFCFLEIIFVWLLVFRPIYTTVLSQHQKLAEALEETEKANKSKSEFLANISHEIRTPMTGILGYAEVLKNHNISQSEQEEAIRVINQNASHLLGLIDEILDIARVESDKMKIKKVPVSLSTLLNETYSLMNVKAKEKGLELRFLNKGSIPTTILTDPKRLRQILFNVLGNAIKFTDRGFIELTTFFNHLNSHNTLTFQIKDTGCGISELHKENLFKPFEQIDSSEDRKQGGAGLGLALSKGLSQGLGGDMTLEESKVGVGSTFEVVIDAGSEAHLKLTPQFSTAVYNSSHPPLNPQLKLAGTKILVVDDAKENARLFKIYLSAVGAHVEVAHDGDTALQLAQNHSFDLVLLDIQMPGKDGYQVLKELKSISFNKPIMALTAHAMEEERKKTSQAGFDGHISKPVTSEDLIQSISQHL